MSTPMSALNGRRANCPLQLAQQFVAALHFINRRHDLEILSPQDKIRDGKQEHVQQEGKT